MTIEDYIDSHITSEPALRKQITRQTNLHQLNPHMLSSNLQGQLLSMLSQLVSPLTILELGTFTGYSAICLSEGLQEGGTLYTIEHNDELETTIEHNIALADCQNKIKLIVGDALDVLASHPVLSKLDLQFDLVFIDADKRQYTKYYEAIINRVRSGGLIIADNTLWDGHIIDPAYDKDHQTIGLRRFNDYVAADERVQTVILPLRDGLTLLKKR